MDRAILRRVGELLYGETPRWHEPLAIDLAVATRTMQRWSTGDREIPELQGELAALCRSRAIEMLVLASELERLSLVGESSG